MFDLTYRVLQSNPKQCLVRNNTIFLVNFLYNSCPCKLCEKLVLGKKRRYLFVGPLILFSYFYTNSGSNAASPTVSRGLNCTL